jgi:integrase/recombinase XerD
MTTARGSKQFDRQYQAHLKHLRLKGLQPKTIEAYSRAIRRIGEYFDQRIDALTEAQLTEYFSELINSHSWSAVKLDLYGLKFYYEHVLKKPWVAPGLIKPPRAQRLPDIVTVAEADRLFGNDFRWFGRWSRRVWKSLEDSAARGDRELPYH